MTQTSFLPHFSSGAVLEPACAKVNLTLHVTGKRADGYHDLESLVAFCALHDTVAAEPEPAGTGLSLRVVGPMAGGLAREGDNIMLRAARRLAGALGRDPDVRLTLIKRLPVASGIGGGSADAAATVRALIRLWGQRPSDTILSGITLGLGADVPVCFRGKAVTMTGVGEHLKPAPSLPSAGLVLVNPLKPLSTPSVFKARQGAFSRPNPLTDSPPSAEALADALRERRNDLTEPAEIVEPAIRTVLDALDASPGSLLARMSGSGATCFALYSNGTMAQRAAQTLSEGYRDWWIKPSCLVCDTSDVSVAGDEL